MVEYNIPKHTIQSFNNRYPGMLSTPLLLLLILNELPKIFEIIKKKKQSFLVVDLCKDKTTLV